MSEQDNRTVTTVEELEALPVKSIIQEEVSEQVWMQTDAEYWEGTGMSGGWYQRTITLPATVLFAPPTTEGGE